MKFVMHHIEGFRFLHVLGSFSPDAYFSYLIRHQKSSLFALSLWRLLLAFDDDNCSLLGDKFLLQNFLHNEDTLFEFDGLSFSRLWVLMFALYLFVVCFSSTDTGKITFGVIVVLLSFPSSNSKSG